MKETIARQLLREDYCSLVLCRESELTRKLELGKEEYTKKATEAMELSKQLKQVQVCVSVV